MIKKLQTYLPLAYTSTAILLAASVFAPCVVARSLRFPFNDLSGIPLTPPVNLNLWDVQPHLATALLFVGAICLVRRRIFRPIAQHYFEIAMPLVVIAGFFAAVIGVPMRLQDSVRYGLSWGIIFFSISVGLMTITLLVSARAASLRFPTGGTKRLTLPEEVCWSCGSAIPADLERCPNCGWPEVGTRDSGEPDDARESPS